MSRFGFRRQADPPRTPDGRRSVCLKMHFQIIMII
jgi:hypothetical protein